MKGLPMPDNTRPIEVGLFLNVAERMMDGETANWNDIKSMAQRAEAIGFDSVWLPDHLLFRMESDNPEGFWECLSMLAAIAAVTNRVKLGAAVICVSFRNPAVFAKMIDTLDEISGGRMVVGLGAGYHDPEYRAFGLPTDHRYSRFIEAFTIIRELLRTGSVDFEGRFHSASECELRPRGPRPEGPSIMIGATGHKMLRLTAEYADEWNGWLPTRRNHPSAVPDLTRLVDEACQDVGRDPATLRRSLGVLISPVGRAKAHVSRLDAPITGEPAEIADTIREFADQGIDALQVWVYPTSLHAIEAFAPVLEELGDPA